MCQQEEVEPRNTLGIGSSPPVLQYDGLWTECHIRTMQGIVMLYLAMSFFFTFF